MKAISESDFDVQKLYFNGKCYFSYIQKIFELSACRVCCCSHVDGEDIIEAVILWRRHQSTVPSVLTKEMADIKALEHSTLKVPILFMLSKIIFKS